MNGHSCAFLLLEVFRLFPESEGVSGDVFEDVLGIGDKRRICWNKEKGASNAQFERITCYR